MSENIHLPECYCNNGLAWVSKPLTIRSLLTLLDGKDTASTHFFFESLREIVVQESGGPRPGAYFTVLEGQGRRRLGRAQACGDEYIGQDTCICKRQKSNSNLLRKKKGTKILLELINDRLRAGAESREVTSQ